MSEFSLDGGVCFVTGAASGIGQAIAVGAAQAGAKIACVDMSPQANAQTVELIERAGGTAIALGADVTDADALAEAVNRTEAELGLLNLAVNAAGIASAAPAIEMTREEWQRVYDVDVTGVFLSVQAEAKAMLRNGSGSIVNIASMSGTIANRGLKQIHYNSAKAAVIHLTKSLAVEWAREGIRVNAISPGYTATPMNLRPEVKNQLAGFAEDTPMGRVAQPHEMAGPAVFLLSQAASFCTGVDLLVDGGFCCW